MSHDLPPLALALIQPYAWAVIYCGKDFENRSRGAMKYLTHRGRTAIHASAGMTRADYEEGFETIRAVAGVQCPAPADLERGGIIGSVDIYSSHKSAAPEANISRWQFERQGLRLRDPIPHKFVPVTGALGFFGWVEIDRPPIAPARWMLPKDAALRAEDEPDDLFNGNHGFG